MRRKPDHHLCDADGNQILCCWCEKSLPKKPTVVDGQTFCGTQCHSDSEQSAWPSWMSGRIGSKPSQDWHMSHGYLCLSAPNRYRNVYRRRSLTRDEAQSMIIDMQTKEFPHLANPQGIDIELSNWDQVLLWKGPTVAEASRGQLEDANAQPPQS